VAPYFKQEDDKCALPRKLNTKNLTMVREQIRILNTANLVKDVGSTMVILKTWLTTKISPHIKEKEKLVNFV
jgi:hypothetical protein